MKYIFTFSILLITFLTFSQTEFKVNTELLNVRSGPGTKYDVVGQVKLNERVLVTSTYDDWSEIKTDDFQGFVSTKYISKINSNSDKEDDSSIIGWLIGLGIIGYILIKVKNFFSRLFGGSSSNTRRSSSPKQKPKQRQSSNSAVYRFRIKGNGTAGGVKYADGMNVEVAVTGLGSGGSPFNNIVEKKFVEEFARKYNIEPRFHSGIKMLFKRDSVDVERI